ASDLATFLEQDYTEHNRPNDNAKYGSFDKGKKGQYSRPDTSQPPYKKQNTSSSFTGSTDGTKRNTRFMGTCFSCARVGHKASDCKSSERNWGKSDQGKSEFKPYEQKPNEQKSLGQKSYGAQGQWKGPTDRMAEKRPGQVFAIGQEERDMVMADASSQTKPPESHIYAVMSRDGEANGTLIE
ncbi:hypothetical protein FRX31_006466, partial [Thalictrum thalictroides]